MRINLLNPSQKVSTADKTFFNQLRMCIKFVEFSTARLPIFSLKICYPKSFCKRPPYFELKSKAATGGKRLRG